MLRLVSATQTAILTGSFNRTLLSEALRGDKTANIFANSGGYLNVESGFRGNVKRFSGLVAFVEGLSVEFDRAFARNDVHSLGLICAEMKFARENKAQGFLAAIGENNSVADDFAFEINVRFGDGGDSNKLLRYF